MQTVPKMLFNFFKPHHILNIQLSMKHIYNGLYTIYTITTAWLYKSVFHG